MSHYIPLSDFLTERITLLYGALHQGSVTINIDNAELTFNGTSIPYGDNEIDQKIEELNNLIFTYEQEEGDHSDLILYLEDIRHILETTKDRLSWLQ
jgi:hypothetical protein